MARNLAHAVSNARPARASSGVHNAKPVSRAPKAGLSAPQPQAPHPTPQQNQTAENTQQAKAQGGSTLPWDAQAQHEYGEATTAEQSGLAELGAGWAGRETFYGFGTNGANNPYSQAALLATHHEWNERGRSNASGLQAFAGSNVNAEREEIGRYTTSYGQLLQAYEAEKSVNEAKEARVKKEGEEGREAAQLGAIQRAGETEPEPVAPPDGGGGGGGGDKPGLGGDSAHPNAYRAGVGAGKSKPQAPAGYHAYKGPGNQWWFAPNS